MATATISRAFPSIPTIASLAACYDMPSVDGTAPIVIVPEPLPTLIAGTQELAGRLTGTAQPLNLDKIREALVQSWACSGAAAARDLGLQPAKPLAERLQTTAQWYLDQNWI